MLINSRAYFMNILAVLLLVGFTATTFISYYVARDSLSRQIAQSTLPLTSDNIYSEIQRDLLRPIFISSLMAQDTFVRDWTIQGEKNKDSIIRYLKEIQERYGTVTCFFVSEKTRNYYHPSGIVKKINDEDPMDRWYYRVRNIKDDYEINIDFNTFNNQSLTIFINYRVYDYKGRYIGATGVGLAVNAVKDLIRTYQQRYSRQVYFTDLKGNVTLHSINYKGSDNIHETPGLEENAAGVLSSPNSSLTYENNGKTVYLNSRLVPEFGWYLMVEQMDAPEEARVLKTLIGNITISILITAVVLVLVNITIGGYQRRLEKMASTDKLTGALNRQGFEILFEQAIKYYQRKDSNLSGIIFDLDHFKKINDTYGHVTGDIILRNTAVTAKANIRESDIICRWGGEEFIVILADCHRSKAIAIAENIRQAVEKSQENLHRGQVIKATASFGVATLMPGEEMIDLLKRMDKALYTSKAKGRNQVNAA